MIIRETYLAAVVLYLGIELEVVTYVLSFKMKRKHVHVMTQCCTIQFLRDTEDHNVDYYQ